MSEFEKQKPHNQPLAERYASEVQSVLDKYPAGQKRSAVMPLLYLAQRQDGYVNKQAMKEIASILEITPTEVAGIVGFYSLYYDEPAGKYRIQVCTDLPCALRGADQFLENLCANLGIKVGETTPDGLVTVEAVMCLAGCNKAPVFQVQTGEGLEYHEHQTVDEVLSLVASWREQAQSQPPAETSPDSQGAQAASAPAKPEREE
jgi:NADH-quinone oxidoreductase subunit E